MYPAVKYGEQRPISLSALPYPSHPSNIQYCLNFLPSSPCPWVSQLAKKKIFLGGNPFIWKAITFLLCGWVRFNELESNHFKFRFCQNNYSFPLWKSLDPQKKVPKNGKKTRIENCNKSFSTDFVWDVSHSFFFPIRLIFIVLFKANA